MIEKIDKLYYLTNEGKQFVGKLDDTNMQQEKQPKISVGILVTKEVNGELWVLLNKRLKQPYFGKVGGFTGKVRFGETFEEAARRELLEETGLTAEFELCHQVRKIAYKKDKSNVVQDQIMFMFRATITSGDLIERQQENENFWEKYSNISSRTDLFNTFIGYLEGCLNNKMQNIEHIVEAEGF